MDSLYVAIRSFTYEGDEVIGVFDTPEEAWDACYKDASNGDEHHVELLVKGTYYHDTGLKIICKR